jgi:creatinine amidohydrolase
VINRYLLTTATSPDESRNSSDVAVLPVGSFEQHGAHLPLITDTVIACAIAGEIARAYDLHLVARLTFSCSHEHGSFAGTVSISSATVALFVRDIAADLLRQNIRHLVLINAHGGNYVLSNIVQEANVARRSMLLFPGSADWKAARVAAGCLTTVHDDMHAGEAETSILLHVAPELVREDWATADWQAPERPLLTLLGMQGYTPTGVIGTPSQATADKGRLLLAALVDAIDGPLKLLRGEQLELNAPEDCGT